MADLFTPYSTAKPYFGKRAPAHASADDAERIQAYQLYEEMYWGESTTGIEVEDTDPLLVPTARVIIEAIHSFLAVGWDIAISGTSEDDVARCRAAFSRLSKREQLRAKVSSSKRYGLIRGDAMLHVIADPNKPAGSRISIEELDPASYFPIYELDDPQRIVGCHILDQLVLPDETVVARRLTYRKQLDDFGVATGVITSEISLFELNAWDDRFGADDIKLLRVVQPEMELPPEIAALPVYHWKNTRNPADLFGSSVIRGIEKVLKSIDQVITDQDLSIALTSLGVYTTDSSRPEGGDWVIGPARVVETKPGTSFSRVPGITSITPSLDHANYLESKARAGSGVPAVAVGEVSAGDAESGIALALKLLPLLSANGERELEMLSVLDHMLYDLQTMWFPAYEDIDFGLETVVESVVRDPLPVNKAAVVEETMALYAADLITLRMAIDRLSTVGWVYAEDAIEELLNQAAMKSAMADPFGARMSEEVDDDDTTDIDA